MNYEYKYFKYKNKYLELKNQAGGEFYTGELVERCATSNQKQVHGTCWANSIFNIFILVPYLGWFFLNKFYKRCGQDFGTDYDRYNVKTCESDRLHQIWQGLYKLKIKRDLDLDISEMVRKMAITPSVVNSWKPSIEDDGTFGGSSGKYLGALFQKIIERGLIDPPQDVPNYKDEFGKLYDNKFLIYNHDQEPTNDIGNIVSKIVWKGNKYYLRAVVIRFQTTKGGHVIAGYICNNSGLDTEYIYDSNTDEPYMLNWTKKQNIIDSYNTTTRRRLYGEITYVTYNCSIYVNKEMIIGKEDPSGRTKIDGSVEIIDNDLAKKINIYHTPFKITRSRLIISRISTLHYNIKYMQERIPNFKDMDKDQMFDSIYSNLNSIRSSLCCIDDRYKVKELQARNPKYIKSHPQNYLLIFNKFIKIIKIIDNFDLDNNNITTFISNYNYYFLLFITINAALSYYN